MVRRRAYRCPRALRRSRAPLHGAVSARPLRPRRRPRSLGGVRVVAYAVLMTDAYPPFRLDQGEDDPAGAATMAPDASPAGAALEQPPPAAHRGAPLAARRSWTRRPHRRGSHRGAALAGAARRRHGARRGRSSPARRGRLPHVPERGLLHRDVRHRLRECRRGLRRLRARRTGDPRRRPHPQRERARRLRRHRQGHRRRGVPERRRALGGHGHRRGSGVLTPLGRRAHVSSRRPGLLGGIHERSASRRSNGNRRTAAGAPSS